MYGSYGRQEDLEFVQKSVDLTGSVLLLRAGKISFAQQVFVFVEFCFEGNTGLY